MIEGLLSPKQLYDFPTPYHLTFSSFLFFFFLNFPVDIFASSLRFSVLVTQHKAELSLTVPCVNPSRSLVARLQCFGRKKRLDHFSGGKELQSQLNLELNSPENNLRRQGGSDFSHNASVPGSDSSPCSRATHAVRDHICDNPLSRGTDRGQSICHDWPILHS